jgi:hypothetical protein
MPPEIRTRNATSAVRGKRLRERLVLLASSHSLFESAELEPTTKPCAWLVSPAKESSLHKPTVAAHGTTESASRNSRARRMLAPLADEARRALRKSAHWLALIRKSARISGIFVPVRGPSTTPSTEPKTLSLSPRERLNGAP